MKNTSTNTSNKKTRIVRKETLVQTSNIRIKPVMERAANYVSGYALHLSSGKRPQGLTSIRQIKANMIKIDKEDKLIDRYLEKIKQIKLRQSTQATKLDTNIKKNLRIVRAYLPEDDNEDFR